jgi:hypothetical protein
MPAKPIPQKANPAALESHPGPLTLFLASLTIQPRMAILVYAARGF